MAKKKLIQFYRGKAANLPTLNEGEPAFTTDEKKMFVGSSGGNVGVSMDGHKHTKAQITDFPTSMPASDVPAWAKAENKPTYTASEVGAAPASHGHSYNDLTDKPTIPTIPSSLPANGGDANTAVSTKPITTAGDGAAYTATVAGITALTAGVQFVMVPHTVSTSTTPTLNVNGLGAKGIRRRLSNLSTSAQSGYAANWLASGKAYTLTYDGSYWIVEGLSKPAVADLYGTLAVDKGGTGYNSIVDTTYTTARYRASALVSAETNPTDNGVINWTYE